MWVIRIEGRAAKDLAALSCTDQARILDYLETRVAPRHNPRELGEALTGPLAGLWKYRIGPFRVISRIRDQTVQIWVVRVGNRREVYR